MSCRGVIARFDPGLYPGGCFGFGLALLAWLNLDPDGCLNPGSDAGGCFCLAPIVCLYLDGGLDPCLDPFANLNLGPLGFLDLCPVAKVRLVLDGTPVLMLLSCMTCSVVST